VCRDVVRSFRLIDMVTTEPTSIPASSFTPSPVPTATPVPYLPTLDEFIRVTGYSYPGRVHDLTQEWVFGAITILYLLDARLGNEEFTAGDFATYSRDNLQTHQFVARETIEELLDLERSQGAPDWVDSIARPSTYGESQVSWKLARTAARARYPGLLGDFLPDTDEGDQFFDRYRSSDRFGQQSYLAWLASSFSLN